MSKQQIHNSDDYATMFGKPTKNNLSREEDLAYIKRVEKAFEIALDTRKFEIEMYWKRANYFWLFVAAIFVAWGNLQTKQAEVQSYVFLNFMLIGLGIIVSFCWYCVNRGSKFWQQNWEDNIYHLSKLLQIPIFGIISNTKEEWSALNKHYPYSVSKVNQLVSLFVTFFWVLMCYYQVYVLWFFESKCGPISVVGGISLATIIIAIVLYIIHNYTKGFASKENLNSSLFFVRGSY